MKEKSCISKGPNILYLNIRLQGESTLIRGLCGLPLEKKRERGGCRVRLNARRVLMFI